MRSAREFYHSYNGHPIDAIFGGAGTYHFSMNQLLAILQAALSDGYQTGYAQVSNRDATISQLVNEKTNLQRDIQQKNQRISSLESSNSSLSSQVSGLNSQINSSNSQVRSLTSQLTTERNNSAMTVSSLKNQHQVEIKKIQEKFESDIASLRSSLQKTAQAKISQLEAENTSLQSKLQQVTTESSVLEKQLSEAKLAVETCHTEIDVLQAGIEKLNKELSQLKEKTESKMIEVKTRIGLFKQIIDTPSSVDLSDQQSGHTQTLSNIK